MTIERLNQLKDERARLVTQMTQKRDEFKARGQGMSQDELALYNRMGDGVLDLDSRIQAFEDDAKATRGSKGSDLIAPELSDDNDRVVRLQKRAFEKIVKRGLYHREVHVEERKAYHTLYAPIFDAYVRGGMEVLTLEQRQIMQPMFVQAEQRDMGTQPGAAGGFTVPPEWEGVVEKVQKDFGGLLASEGQPGGVRVTRTSSGADLPIPTLNDTNNKGHIITENTANTNVDMVYGQKNLKAFTYTSDFVPVSIQLLQDTGVDLEGEIPEVLGERLGRGIADHLISGTGLNQPTGIITAATQGKLAAGASSVTFPEIQALEHSVDPAYRRQGSRFVFNDTTFLAIKGLADTTGLPLWQPNIAAAAPATLDGFPYTIDQSMPAMTTGLKPILFGNLNKYRVRMVRGIILMRLSERFADKFQVAFIAFERLDADLVDGGGGAVKFLKMA